MSEAMRQYAGPCAFCGLDFVATWVFSRVPDKPMCPTCDGRLIKQGAEIAMDEDGKAIGFLTEGGVLFQKGVISIQVDDDDMVIG